MIYFRPLAETNLCGSAVHLMVSGRGLSYRASTRRG
jgi:hypothetical protein